MKNINTYIVLVDSHRPFQLGSRNTAGRYRVGAKSEKEAEEILRAKIKFGSIRVYYKCSSDDLPVMQYKEVLKEFSKEVSIEEKISEAGKNARKREERLNNKSKSQNR